MCIVVHLTHSKTDSVIVSIVVDALTSSPPSTCRCFWDNQEGEAGSILFQKLLGPVANKVGPLPQDN